VNKLLTLSIENDVMIHRGESGEAVNNRATSPRQIKKAAIAFLEAYR